MSKLLFFFSAIPWLIIGVLLSSSSPLTLPSSWRRVLFPSDESASPFSPSWNSWWHPHSQAKIRTHDSKARNSLYHLGGYGPWIEKIEGVVVTGDVGIGPPKGCAVDGVHMVLLSFIRFYIFSASFFSPGSILVTMEPDLAVPAVDFESFILALCNALFLPSVMLKLNGSLDVKAHRAVPNVQGRST